MNCNFWLVCRILISCCRRVACEILQVFCPTRHMRSWEAHADLRSKGRLDTRSKGRLDTHSHQEDTQSGGGQVVKYPHMYWQAVAESAALRKTMHKHYETQILGKPDAVQTSSAHLGQPVRALLCTRWSLLNNPRSIAAQISDECGVVTIWQVRESRSRLISKDWGDCAADLLTDCKDALVPKLC